MSGQEDFGPLVDVLLACVGVLDVISLTALMIPSPPPSSSVKKITADMNNNDVMVLVGNKSSSMDQTRSIPMVVVDNMIKDGDMIDSLMSKVNELEAKVTELEVRSRESSMERFIETERYRRSRSPSPYGECRIGAAEENEDTITHTNLITRDDEFRKTIKRSSKGSSTHETREEELATLSDLEAEEMTNLNDFVPVVYTQHSDQSDDDYYSHGTIDTIEEISSCPIHGNMSEDIEKDRSPGMSTIIEKPWCDIKKDAGKIRQQEKREQTRRSLSIEGQPVAEKIAVEENINEKFIKSEKVQLQKTSPTRMLMKQAHVNSEEIFNDLDENELVENETKISAEEVASVKTFAPIVEKFPTLNKIPYDEIVNEISKHEQVQAVPLQNELLNPALQPIINILKSPENITSNEHFNAENITEMPIERVPEVEIIDEISNSNFKMNTFTSSLSSLQTDDEIGVSQASAALKNDFAVRSTTPEPDVSIPNINRDSENRETSIERELLNIVGSPSSSGEGLKRTSKFLNSLDRSASRSSSRLSRRSRKSPSVPSEEDYKEWFDKFDNHISSELTVPEDEDFGSDIDEEELLMADDGNLDGAEICNIDEERDVSVSVTLNLKTSSKKSSSPCNPCEVFLQQEKNHYKTKAEEIEEMAKLWDSKKNRRVSIIPSTDEQQHNYVSILHPEEFPSKLHEPKEQHEHHQHLHNVGYSEWIKKIVDHNSSHLTLSDSDSDSDVPLDEVQMLPLFCDEKLRSSMTSTSTKKKKRRK